MFNHEIHRFMEEQKTEELNIAAKSKKKSTPTIFILLSWVALFLGFLLSEGTFNFNLYTEMSMEQRILVTLDQIKAIWGGIGVAIFFVLLAIYYKNKQKT